MDVRKLLNRKWNVRNQLNILKLIELMGFTSDESHLGHHLAKPKSVYIYIYI